MSVKLVFLVPIVHYLAISTSNMHIYSGLTAWSCLSRDYTDRVYLNTLPVPLSQRSHYSHTELPLHISSFHSLNVRLLTWITCLQYAFPILRDDIITLFFLCLSGLGFIWRGERGAYLKPEQSCLPPSEHHCLCLLRLVLIPSPSPSCCVGVTQKMDS